MILHRVTGYWTSDAAVTPPPPTEAVMDVKLQLDRQRHGVVKRRRRAGLYAVLAPLFHRPRPALA